MAPDLPHLFARLSELVHAAGYAPEDLVLIPRAEMDRRETAAFTAGWAEAMSEELPRIRREYEKRVAEAYAAGGGRGGGTAAARRTPGEGHGATVIRLPFATLLEPSPLVVETEERMRRAQEILDRRSDTGAGTDSDHAQTADAEADADPEAGQPRPHDEAGHDGTGPDAPGSDGAERPQGTEPSGEPVPPGRATTAPVPRAPADAREKRTPPVGRKVVRRNGRPIVPPLDSVPVQPRTHGAPADPPADGPGAAGEPGKRSLAARARALAEGMESQGGATGRPEAPDRGR
ncbi:hypothetical protein ACFWBN_16275 [Streptomyces sp. NPDC059989]|uniref:hypothetical protein n=1 Tax=Streptomyces sp. NPDC059989 TaxID=3347026 RepID=UPI003687804F